MVTNGISAFSNLYSFLAGPITEANEPAYVTLQKAFRGDRVAMRKVEQQEEQNQLRQRLQNPPPNPAVGQDLDIFA
jgi:hypothetical protein